MSTSAAVTHARIGTRPAPVRRAYRFELIKLLSQWPIRLALLACWLGPALVVAVISRQSSLPTDTVFGRWLGQGNGMGGHGGGQQAQAKTRGTGKRIFQFHG